MRNKLLVCTALLLSLVSTGSHARADDLEFTETGRFGLMGSVTEDLLKAGPVFYTENLEVNAFAHYDSDSNGDIQLDALFKLGYRIPLQHSNYLSVGAQYQPEFAQKVANVSVSGTYKAGPYVGFQRYFAGNHLMLNFWINPFYFEQTKEAGATGGIVSHHTRHFFQNGGFGLAWLF